MEKHCFLPWNKPPLLTGSPSVLISRQKGCMLTQPFDHAPYSSIPDPTIHHPMASYCNNLPTVIWFFHFSKTMLQNYAVKLLNLLFRCWHKHHTYLLHIPCKELGGPQWEEKQLSNLEICPGGEQWAFQTGCPSLLNGSTLEQLKRTVIIIS